MKKKISSLWRAVSGRLMRLDRGTMEYVRTIQARGEREAYFRTIWKKRLTVLAVLAGVSALVWLYCLAAAPEEGMLSEGQYVVRQPDDEKLRLAVSGSDGKKSWERPVTLEIKSRRFSAEEKKKLSEKAEDYIRKMLPGENKSLEEVTAPLNFVTEVPGTEISLQWTWDTEYIRDSGRPISGHIPEGGLDTEVMAEGAWKNWKKKFRFPVHLTPPDYSREERELQTVKEALSGALKSRPSEAVVKLPEEIGNLKMSYRDEDEKKSFLPVYVLLLVILLLPFLWREQQKKKLAEREAGLLADHPGIVNKIMLLLGAGLTVRKAVERMAAEYERGRKGGEKLRFGYEEICILSQEMRDGMSEKEALERFGRRCRLLPYLRFSSVVTQNLKKGAEGLLDILEKESMEALERRKERALQLGETAGTKLLFPMMLMLGLVMGIIMIPAFMTM